MTDKKKLICRVIYVLLTIGILVVIIPIIIGAGFTYPCEDDFSFEMGARNLSEEYGSFLGGLVGAYKYYIAWQGTYLANFLWHFLRPYDRGGMLGMHVIMIGLAVLLVVAYGVLVKALVKERIHALFVLLVVYIIAFNTSRLGLEREFLYWYTAAVVYSLSVSLACITLAMTIFIKNEENKRTRIYYAVVGVFTGFLASGGNLEVTSFHCSWLLLMLMLCYTEIKSNKLIILPFISSLGGALINACAKGNFARSNMTTDGTGLGIMEALKNTLICWKNEWQVIKDNDFLILLFVVTFIVCYSCKIKIYKNGITTGKMLFLFPAVFLIQFFTAFPVIFGYHSDNLIYGRTTYTYELLAKLMFLFLIISFAQWLGEHFKMSVLVPNGVAIVIGISILINGNAMTNVREGFSYNLVKELQNGTVQEVYEFREKVLALVEQNEKGADVHLKVPRVPESNVMYSMGLTDDPNCVCNSHAAIYYGFNSIIVEYSRKNQFPSQ